MKLIHIVGNRPQFIKLSPVLKASARHGDIKNVIVHSGQHHDYSLSKVFFDELKIPDPDYNLNAGSGTHGVQTGKMLAALDPVLIAEKPDCVLVYGDTNTTLAGALGAYKLNYLCAHVESGLREYVRRAEEINRKVADHCSDFLFCPINRASDNLIKEGIGKKRIFVTGDVTYDAFVANLSIIERYDILSQLDVKSDNYILLTLHRAETVDNYKRLSEVVNALIEMKQPIVFPVHPRTRGKLIEFGLMEKVEKSGNIKLLEPIGYFEFLNLLNHCTLVMADSGGVVKEAFYAGRPCVSLDHTGGHEEIFKEIYETSYILTGTTKDSILSAYQTMVNRTLPTIENNLFGDGHAAENIIAVLVKELASHDLGK